MCIRIVQTQQMMTRLEVVIDQIRMYVEMWNTFLQQLLSLVYVIIKQKLVH